MGACQKTSREMLVSLRKDRPMREGRGATLKGEEEMIVQREGG